MDEHRFPDVEPNRQGFPRLADLISTADDPGSANGHRDSTESGLKINDKNRQLIREVSAETGIVFRSDRMRDLIEESIAYAQSSASVLVTGESGTGKELFARLIIHTVNAASTGLCRSIAPLFRKTSWKASFSDMPRGPLRGQISQGSADSSGLTVGPFYWTKSAKSRSDCKPNCSGSSRREFSNAWDAIWIGRSMSV